MSESCPRCKGVERVKSGMVHGMQRWLCKSCGCNYTKSTARGYQEELEQQAIAHYLTGISLRKIEALMGISHVTVLRWVRDFKAKFLVPFQGVSASDIQVRCQSVETAQDLLTKPPQNPQNRWAIVEVPMQDFPAEGVAVVQPNAKPHSVDEQAEIKTKIPV